MIFIEVIFLVAALSADSFALSTGYGLAGIRIGFFHTLLISVICTVLLLVSVSLAEIAEDVIPKIYTTFCSFAILFITGIVKIFQKPENKEPERLSLSKTVLLALAMSVDGIAAGFGTGLAAGDSIAALAVISPIITFLSIYIGNYVGIRLKRHAPAFIQRLGGVIIICIAFLKLK